LEVKSKSFEGILKYTGRLEKDDAKNLLPEKIALLYKKIFTEWWSI